jgi:acyl-CoA reductase-like NAD-dependent aldehyde dehydrogenase
MLERFRETAATSGHADIGSAGINRLGVGNGGTGTSMSGLGREGIRWAIESMTEVRLLVIRGR